jgi:hypothetical protein
MLLLPKAESFASSSATTAASRLAGSGVLAFSLMLCLLPGCSIAP